MKRIFLIVLDSCGIGQMPDCEKFGDIGVNTLRSCSTSSRFSIPNLLKAGIGNIDGVDYLRFPEAYASVTPEDVRQFLTQTVRPERAALAVVRPREKEKNDA